MNDRLGEGRVPWSGQYRKAATVGCVALLLTAATGAALIAPGSLPQSESTAEPEQTEKLEFDVASVRENKLGGKTSSNVPLGRGNLWTSSGGILSAKNFTLLQYLVFAYKLADYQQEELRAKTPDWAREDKFDIEARTESRDATKDQMRSMMRSLLAERFHLAVHSETRQVPVFALVEANRGIMGAKLQPHPASAVCSDYSANATVASGAQVVNDVTPEKSGFPNLCGGILGMPASARDRYSFGGRDVPMSLIASVFSSWGNLGRPVVDRTGLRGNYDFVLDFTPDPRPSYATEDSGGPTFQEALKQQLGLKLEPQRAPVGFLVLDRVERPSAN